MHLLLNNVGPKLGNVTMEQLWSWITARERVAWQTMASGINLSKLRSREALSDWLPARGTDWCSLA